MHTLHGILKDGNGSFSEKSKAQTLHLREHMSV